jgi:hypothetical protein
MSVDKKVNYDVQGGVKNYLGKQKEVTAPLKWQSSPDHPKTELAYITEAEKDLLVKSDLHGSLKGGVNRGPSGIMSLNGWGSYDDPSDTSRDTGMSGAATSAAESGGGSGADRIELESYISSPPPDPSDVSNDAELGITRRTTTELPQDIKDYRNAFIVAGGGQRVNPGFFDSRYTVSPQEVASAKAYMNRTNPLTGELVNPYAKGAFRKTRGGGLGSFISGGGLLGNIVRGIGQKFGLGKRYNEPTYDMSGYNDLGLHADRFPPGFGIPNFESGDGDYDMLGNKINEITGEITSPTGESLGFIPGYPGSGSDSGGITTIPTGGGDNYTQNVVETINETVDDNIPDEDLLLRYLGDASTLNPEAAGVNSVADLRNLQLQRAKNIYT